MNATATTEPPAPSAPPREDFPATKAQADEEVRRAAHAAPLAARNRAMTGNAQLAQTIIIYEKLLDADDAAGVARAALSAANADLQGIAFRTAADRVRVLTVAMTTVISRWPRDLTWGDIDHAINSILQLAEYHIGPRPAGRSARRAASEPATPARPATTEPPLVLTGPGGDFTKPYTPGGEEHARHGYDDAGNIQHIDVTA